MKTVMTIFVNLLRAIATVLTGSAFYYQGTEDYQTTLNLLWGTVICLAVSGLIELVADEAE